MTYQVDQMRLGGIEKIDVIVNKCDCGCTDIKRTKNGMYHLCAQCDAVYEVKPQRVKDVPEKELAYIKNICF